MVTHSVEALQTVLHTLSCVSTGTLTCPYCDMPGLSEDSLWSHCPLFHISAYNVNGKCCPVCDKTVPGPLQVHIRNRHGPCARGEVPTEHSTGVFAIVICRRRDGRFLMVQEFASSGFWVPGGQVDPGESLCAAVMRETVEEAGVEVRLTGILEVESHDGGRWRRITFMGEPADEQQQPKSVPDYESMGAVWVTVDELTRKDRALRLRNRQEPCRWFPYVANGGPVSPMAIPDHMAVHYHDIKL
eukprot:NODE_138_length_2395_cov_116.295823_g120_i0.p1 GENE.NODE_138_length_2395_cov_116.295823_g120_i0~~NODE_138_length_2395_cov_116.295823_g120_i0.p1  ORF type:complete len:244 (-),score=39.68 NODE_138_length_2395_cov_116.295823_g120_i0:153-884(-)